MRNFAVLPLPPGHGWREGKRVTLSAAKSLRRGANKSAVTLSTATLTLSKAKGLRLSLSRRERAGFTLVETLVAIALIGLLVSLLLPAVNAARESGRRTQCSNNLRQIALAALMHESANGFMPSAGWSGAWVGVPGRGFGRRQAGGWVYSLLGYIERNDLAELGRDDPPGKREAAVNRLLQIPIAIFNCPSRRRAELYPIFYDYARTPRGATLVNYVARSDYAMNCGDQPRCDLYWQGPFSVQEGDDPKFPWPDVSDHTGICYLRSQVAAAQVRDGLSRTYLAGERYLAPAHDDDGADPSDDWSMYSGYQNDVARSTYWPPARDQDETNTCRFGSRHPSTWHAAFCDASVRGLSYDIDPAIHRSLGNRADGIVFGDDVIR
jgi:prepilin-type N-terminal cleavage/methylation domain-containing protein